MPIKALSNVWNFALNAWLSKRFPDTREITLDIQRIFVIPTRLSAALLFAVLVLGLMAINFQNSLIYGLSFWLLALIVIAIFFTYRNLAGLTIRAIQSQPCFAGEKAVFELEVRCPDNQTKTAISIGWPFQDVETVTLRHQHSVHIKLSHSTRQRGRFKAPRLTLFTVYPIGLVVAWSYAALNLESIVYPAPRLQDNADHQQNADDHAMHGAESADGSTDFAGVRDYRSGDSPRKIHWAAYAKTGDLYSKTFVDYASDERWLDWDALPIAGVEAKLSHLCAKVLEYHRLHYQYGLKLPGTLIKPQHGDAHKTTCLTALALFREHR